MKHLRFLPLAAALLLALLALPALAEGPGPHLRLKPGQALIGRFIHEHPVKGFDQPMRTEGRFLLSPGKQIVWAIEKPMATTTTLSNGRLVQSVGNLALLEITSEQMPFLSEVEGQILAALSGDWKKLEKDFIVARKAEGEKWVVAITPRERKGAARPFQKIVARGGAFVEGADILLKDAVDHVVFLDQRLIR